MNPNSDSERNRSVVVEVITIVELHPQYDLLLTTRDFDVIKNLRG